MMVKTLKESPKQSIATRCFCKYKKHPGSTDDIQNVQATKHVHAIAPAAVTLPAEGSAEAPHCKGCVFGSLGKYYTL